MNDVTIIGSGPAGLSAAICVAHMDLQAVVYAGPMQGGNITASPRVEHFLGFPEPIAGYELAKRAIEQVEALPSATVVYDVITKVDFSDRPLKLWCGDQEIESLAVIIATGAVPRKLGLQVEDEILGVSHYALFDGVHYKDKRVLVIGDGNSAMHEAMYLSNICEHVTIVSRNKQFTATSLMVNQVRANEKIEMMSPFDVVAIATGKKGVEGITLENVDSKQTTQLAIEGVFVAIGSSPNSQMFQQFIETDHQGFIVVKNHVETNVTGVFAAGDVTTNTPKQALVAATNGYQAALASLYYLGAVCR